MGELIGSFFETDKREKKRVRGTYIIPLVMKETIILKANKCSIPFSEFTSNPRSSQGLHPDWSPHVNIPQHLIISQRYTRHGQTKPSIHELHKPLSSSSSFPPQARQLIPPNLLQRSGMQGKCRPANSKFKPFGTLSDPPRLGLRKRPVTHLLNSSECSTGASTQPLHPLRTNFTRARLELLLLRLIHAPQSTTQTLTHHRQRLIFDSVSPRLQPTLSHG